MSTAKRQNIALQKLSNLLSQFLMQFLRWHGQKSIEVIVRYFGFLGSLDSGLLEAIIATYGQCQPDSCFAIQICHNKTEQIWHRQSFWHGESSGFTSFKGKTVFESFLDFVRMFIRSDTMKLKLFWIQIWWYIPDFPHDIRITEPANRAETEQRLLLFE